MICLVSCDDTIIDVLGNLLADQIFRTTAEAESKVGTQ